MNSSKTKKGWALPALLVALVTLAGGVSRAGAQDLNEAFMADLREALQTNTYLLSTGVRATLPSRLGRDLIERSEGTRIGLIGGISANVYEDEETDQVDNEEASAATSFFEFQFYEIPLGRHVEVTGLVGYFGEPDHMEEDFDNWNLFRPLKDRTPPPQGIKLKLDNNGEVEYYPLGSGRVVLEATFFNHLQLGFGYTQYAYKIVSRPDGDPESEEFLDLSIMHVSANLRNLGALVGLSEEGGGSLGLFNKVSFSEDQGYLGSVHFIPTGLMMLPAVEFAVFPELNDLVIGTLFLETPPTYLGSLSFKPSFANKSTWFAEVDVFYNFYNPLLWFYREFLAEEGEELPPPDTARERTRFLKGEPGRIISVGVGFTYTNLYPYGIRGETDYDGHISPYFSMNGAFRWAEGLFGYGEISWRHDTLDSVPNMLGLDQGKEGVISANFGIGLQLR
ncbi:hypothetical protein [Alkalispirochaeta alkalica]|uniref:hypothetical protein n=1 Tax=Alkalispirochaeta alkalica TaxID=46356 RepID=UPI00039D6C5B|nr:hypothetical protein [Alkalispirochaeta alkalica]